jgi:hypothetical protein
MVLLKFQIKKLRDLITFVPKLAISFVAASKALRVQRQPHRKLVFFHIEWTIFVHVDALIDLVDNWAVSGEHLYRPRVEKSKQTPPDRNSN